MSGNFAAIVLAGGGGKRFWPLSSAEVPKQLLALGPSGQPLLTDTLDRLKPVFGSKVYSVAGRSVARKIVELGIAPAESIFEEPEPRDSLGGILWGVANLIAKNPGKWQEITVGVFPADHLISGDVFGKQMGHCLSVASEGQVFCLLGIPPSRPETGYGYIEVKGSSAENAEGVLRFHEKPDLELAEQYVQAKRFLWNSGTVFFRLDTLMRVLQDVAPDTANTLVMLADAMPFKETAVLAKLFGQIPRQSFDHAVLEKTLLLKVVRGEFEWDDLGSWEAMLRNAPPDEHGNHVRGCARLESVRGSLIVNQRDDIEVDALGLEDFIVVVSGKHVLICPRSQSQNVRLIADRATEQ
ncbi:MAG: mannose-1-phosphate guanylyltransferase [Armatimonadetes bacterium]|nr:mannose-1-phosphate guanylyltransferase [Armatimonadota bacterium]